MARIGNSETRAAYVFDGLRQGILSGEYAPGMWLRPAELRGQFGVSASVIREALARLAEQRLVQTIRNRGFRVTPLSRQDLLDLTDVRVTIEGYALRRAVMAHDVGWESRVLAAHHQLASTPRTGPEGGGRTSPAWTAAHQQFHMTLISGCGIPVLIDMCGLLYDASEMYRRLSARYVAAQRDPAQEHSDLVEMTLAGDADAAVETLEMHVRRTTSLLLESLPTADEERDGAGEADRSDPVVQHQGGVQD